MRNQIFPTFFEMKEFDVVWKHTLAPFIETKM